MTTLPVRRTRSILALIVTALLLAMPFPGSATALASEATQASIDPGAGSWRTWVLASGAELRLPPPPDRQAADAELQEVTAQVSRRDAAALDRIRYWDALSPSHRWNEMLTDLGVRDHMSTGAGFRSFAMLNVALHDAMIAAWDSKHAHRRPRPAALDRSLATAVATPPGPSYPCERAVAAGAGAAVLAHLFPKDAARLQEAAEEAARSRVQAGVAFPADVKAGLELGRAVAARVIEHMKLDGKKWAGTVPVGPGLWKGSNPAGIDAIRWRTFLLSSPDQFRAPAPPAPDSPERAAELAEVKQFPRTPRTTSRAFFWQFGGWGQAGQHYAMSRELAIRLRETGQDASAPRAARAYALVHLATYEAFVASQDSKFHYWTARPAHFDPTITTIFPTPNFPTYPSNAAAVGMAPMLVLGHLFPREAARYEAWAREFGDSRIWSGIHFRSDVESGYEMGRRVAALVVERARRDGAE